MAIATLAAFTTAVGLGAVAYASGFERNRFTLRETTLPILPRECVVPGGELRILHLSDFHMMPGQKRKQRFISSLASTEPHLVINTGDNLSQDVAIDDVIQTVKPFLSLPGAFVFGSNDYYAAGMRNPFAYIGLARKKKGTTPLQWERLRDEFTAAGWSDLTNAGCQLSVQGLNIVISGVDDPHLSQDDVDSIAQADPGADLAIGLTHSPEPRVLDIFETRGFDLVMAGHTHGGQLCLPILGALVTNCGLDRSRASGVSAWGRRMFLHVSAGLGTSPFVPFRTFCPPEATLLRLIPAV